MSAAFFEKNSRRVSNVVKPSISSIEQTSQRYGLGLLLLTETLKRLHSIALAKATLVMTLNIFVHLI